MPTHARVRAFLENVAKCQTPITYQELTKAVFCNVGVCSSVIPHGLAENS
jgi:hypothetical protein